MAESQPSNPLLTAALAYAEAGLAVFPVHDVTAGACSCGKECASPGKHPRTLHGLSEATTDAGQILAWWTAWPTSNVAINCGRSGLVVADVDVKKGAEGRATVAWYLERFPEFGLTRTIATPTGGLHYYFTGTAKSGQGTLGAGVDVRGEGGYVLAPPSVVFGQYDEQKRPIPGSQAPYTVLNGAPALPYPIAPLAAAGQNFTLGELVHTRSPSAMERERVPYGEHRPALLRLAWTLRRVHGLTTAAALPVLRGFVDTTLDGYDPNRPFTDRDLAGMLEALEPNIAAGPIESAEPIALAKRILSAEEVLSRLRPPKETLVAGLLLRAELHTFYGEDGVGKSSLVAYLLALVTRRGLDVLVFIGEDQPEDFSIKFDAAGGDLKRLYLYEEPAGVEAMLLPKHKAELEQLLASRAWGAIYFDSIGDIKSADVRVNAADAARQLFGPLSTYAQRYNAAIICTAHTNASGVLEGARQVRAKSRIVARVTRPKASEIVETDFSLAQLVEHDPKWTTIVTTEKFSRGLPGAVYAFHFEEQDSFNSVTGEIEREIGADETPINKKQYVCIAHDRMEPESAGREIIQEYDYSRDVEIAQLLRSNPAVSANSIVKQLGGQRVAMLAAIRRVKASM